MLLIIIIIIIIIISSLSEFLGRLVPGTQCDFKLDNCSQRFALIMITMMLVMTVMFIIMMTIMLVMTMMVMTIMFIVRKCLLRSPHYPGMYPVNISCSYHVFVLPGEIPPGKQVFGRF